LWKVFIFIFKGIVESICFTDKYATNNYFNYYIFFNKLIIIFCYCTIILDMHSIINYHVN